MLSSSVKDEQQVFASFHDGYMRKTSTHWKSDRKKRNIAIRAKRFKRDITGKMTIGENSLLRGKENVPIC